MARAFEWFIDGEWTRAKQLAQRWGVTLTTAAYRANMARHQRRAVVVGCARSRRP